MSEKLYGDRDPIDLDMAGNYFSKHMGAMTGEGLHGKAEIAEELGYRDMIIAELLEALEEHCKVCKSMGIPFECGKCSAGSAIKKAHGETP